MILVAGGTGRLGRIVVQRLLTAGEQVRVLSRRPGGAGNPLSPETVVGDVRDPAAVARAVAGARVVISAVSAFGMKGVTPRQVDLDGNVNLIAAAEGAGVERFVLVSVRGAAARHPMELARMKYVAEQRLTRSRLAWAILRPSTFTETFQQILCAPLLSNGKTVVFGRASNPVNFVSADDVARFVELAVLTDQLQGAITDLGGPQNLSLVQFVETFAAALGVVSSIRHIPRAMLWLLSWLARPFNRTFARMARAGVLMDTTDMAFDPVALAQRYPQIRLTPASEVAVRDYARLVPAKGVTP
ncbi:MAG TPA: SDR family oxidoreductase [Polyangia bacterium]|nr:SDR family oxidoreductase [Polyangia bacterium]